MKNLLLLLLCIGTINISAQVKLSGRVLPQISGDTLDGTALYIPELKRGTTTDASGNFSFSDLPKGNYLLNVKYVGYASQNIPLKLSGDTSIVILLSQTAAELNDVVVTGISKATELKESPIAITLVSQRNLQTTTAANIVDAISKLPNISAVTTGAAISKPIVRGLGYNRVIVLNDGFRQEGQQWGDEHGVEIDEASISRIEILRGAGSLMYGSDAIAGVINFLPSEPIAEGKIALHAMLNYQSNNHLISASLMQAGNIKGWNWNIRGSYKLAGNYTNKYDNRVWNSGFEERNLSGEFGANKKWGYSKISFSMFNQQIGFNEGLRDTSGNFLQEVKRNDSISEMHPVIKSELNGYGFSIPYQRVNHHRISIQNKIFTGKGSLVLNTGWQMNERREFSDVFKPSEANLHFQMHTATLDVQYHLPEMKDWNTVFGLSGMYQQSMNRGEEFLIPTYQVFDYGIFGITQKRFGKFLFETGLRFDQRFYYSKRLLENFVLRFEELQKTFYNFSGSIGFSYKANESWVLKFNASKGFRSPNAAELSSNGNHEGVSRYEYGNRDLKPESNFEIDAGVNYTSEHVNLNFDVFENTILHFIYLQKLSSTQGGDSLLNDGSGNLISAFQFKQNNALLAGAEVTVDIHPHPVDWLHFENSFGYVYAVNLHQPDSAKFLPFTPPAHYRSELRFDIPKTGKIFQNVFAGIHFDYYFRQNNVFLQNNTETTTSGYALLGFSTGLDVHSKNKMKLLTLIFSGENLTNTAYQSHLSRIKYLDVNPANGKRGIWNAGRNFSVKIILPLEFSTGKNRN